MDFSHEGLLAFIGRAVGRLKQARQAVYDYDSLGGIASIKYWWETLQGNGTYTQAPIFAADATYGHALGLKDSAGFFGPSGGGFSLQRRENYSYDAQNDFLTQVDYHDGQANELQSWDYDPAGNRKSASANPGSWSYDKLNRIVSSPFGSYTHDMAGNRLTGPGQTLAWDVTNRLTGLNGVTHRYRADAMRVQKVAANGDTYRWHYDAQMPVEETRVVGGQTTVMRNIVGPRGIDIQFDGANGAFPLYDTHGNAKVLLARSGSSFTTVFWRQYDVWGSLRPGSTPDGASQRYCGRLGHVTDDESAFVYMRARFYDPSIGRLVSEDPAGSGANWYLYVTNSPARYIDKSGLEGSLEEEAAADSIAADLESSGGGYNFQAVAQDKIHKIFSPLNKNQARELIHLIKREERLGVADDLLYDFAKDMLSSCYKNSGTIECLGTLKAIIDMFLETGRY